MSCEFVDSRFDQTLQFNQLILNCGFLNIGNFNLMAIIWPGSSISKLFFI
jgi:hypothetical protein